MFVCSTVCLSFCLSVSQSFKQIFCFLRMLYLTFNISWVILIHFGQSVCLSVCLSVCTPIYSLFLSVCLSVSLYVFQSILSMYLSFVFLFYYFDQSVCLSVCQSNLCFCLPAWVSVRLPVYSLCVSAVCLSVCVHTGSRTQCCLRIFWSISGFFNFIFFKIIFQGVHLRLWSNCLGIGQRAGPNVIKIFTVGIYQCS
jgi:hypothetical protein